MHLTGHSLKDHAPLLAGRLLPSHRQHSQVPEVYHELTCVFHSFGLEAETDCRAGTSFARVSAKRG